jgi:hypothetical protein
VRESVYELSKVKISRLEQLPEGMHVSVADTPLLTYKGFAGLSRDRNIITRAEVSIYILTRCSTTSKVAKSCPSIVQGYPVEFSGLHMSCF